MKALLVTFGVLAVLYALLCTWLYFNQESMIFFPEKLTSDYRFKFNEPCEELRFVTNDHVKLSGLYFKASPSKGLVFYLHGNGGSLRTWGEVAGIYTQSGFDVLMLDYRGYGKSEGSIQNETQFYQDIQEVLNQMKLRYDEKNIIVLGYSIGTGPATWLAAHNPVKRLILQAPYYSLRNMMKRNYPIAPTFLLKYVFETSRYLPQCKMPVTIFHGDADPVIPYQSSIELKKLFKRTDTLITLPGWGHNAMGENALYLSAIKDQLK